MSHGIEKRDKQYGITQAWHGLTEVREVITQEEVFPWKIVLGDSFFSYQKVNEDGTMSTITQEHGSNVVPLASDDFLPLGTGNAVNPESYTIRTPAELWALRDRILVGVNNTVVSAGTVNNRGKYFISTKLNDLEQIRLQDGTTVELLLNSMGATDKTLVEQHSISSTRIVCQNTLMMSFLGDKLKWRFRHSKNMNEHITNSEEAMENAAGASAVVEAAFNSLLNYSCSKDRAEAIYTGLIVSDGQECISPRARNMIDQHIQCFESGAGNTGKTEFDLLNGWTELKTKGYADSDKGKWGVFETSEFGAYANQKVHLAIMLLKNREGLEKVAARGRELIKATEAVAIKQL